MKSGRRRRIVLAGEKEAVESKGRTVTRRHERSGEGEIAGSEQLGSCVCVRVREGTRDVEVTGDGSRERAAGHMQLLESCDRKNESQWVSSWSPKESVRLSSSILCSSPPLSSAGTRGRGEGERVSWDGETWRQTEDARIREIFPMSRYIFGFALCV